MSGVIIRRRETSSESGDITVSVGSGPITSGSVLSATVSNIQTGQSITWQFTDDSQNIVGASGAGLWPETIQFTPAIGSDGIAESSLLGVTITVDGGDPVSSATREIRYAAGSVTESALADWTIDDDVININFASDFSVPNLTGTYVITDLGAGIVDDTDGTISGTATGIPETRNPVATFTDQYGRTVVGNYSVNTVYRTAAVAGNALDLSFPQSVAITTTNLLSTWALNGNTPQSFVITPALPAGLSAAIVGSELRLTGTPSSVTADASYSIEVTFEYSRVTTGSMTLEITDAASITINPTTTVYTEGGNGAGPTLTVRASQSGGTPNYTAFFAFHPNSTTLTKSNVENGTGDATDFGSVTASSLDALDTALTLTNTMTNGHVSVFIRDSAAVESDLLQIDNVDVDADVPTFSSSIPADGATDVAADASISLTFSETILGVSGKDIYLYSNIDTTPVLVETFVMDDADSGTGDNGGALTIVDASITITPGAAMSNSTEHSIRWEQGVLIDNWGNELVANTGDTTLNFTTVAAGDPFAIIPLQINNTNTAGPSFIIDLSGASSGDRIVLFYGNRQVPTGVTLDSTAMTNVAGATKSSGNSGTQISTWELVLSGPGSAFALIAITNSGSTNQHALTGAITDMQIADSGVDGDRGTALSDSVTPTGATNRILAAAIGESGANGFTWTNVTEDSSIATGSPEVEGSIALAEDVPASALTVTATPGGTGSSSDCAMAVVALVP